MPNVKFFYSERSKGLEPWHSLYGWFEEQGHTIHTEPPFLPVVLVLFLNCVRACRVCFFRDRVSRRKRDVVWVWGLKIESQSTWIVFESFDLHDVEDVTVIA